MPLNRYSTVQSHSSLTANAVQCVLACDQNVYEVLYDVRDITFILVYKSLSDVMCYRINALVKIMLILYTCCISILFKIKKNVLDKIQSLYFI